MSFTSWLRNLRSVLASSRVDRKHRRRSLRPATHRPQLEVLEDRCLLSFNPAVSYPVGMDPQAVLTADFNGDGQLDLAVANYSSADVSVLLGNADGTFQPAVTSATWWRPVALAVGDFNKDGKLDLVTANYYGSTGIGNSSVSVLLGNGTGSFEPPTNIDIDSTLWGDQSVAVGDFNGDGNMDLGVTSNVYTPGHYGPGSWREGDYGYYYYPGTWYPGYYEGRANVLLGNGDGSFSTTPNITPLGYGYGAWATTAANLNGDGFDDFVTVNAEYGYVNVLLGDSSGYLQGPSSFFTGYYSDSLAAGDVNGDSNIDVVTANVSSNNVSVLLGDGAGGFGAAGNYATGVYPASVVLGDFTGDGNVDVATTNYYSHDLSVLYGIGNGAFSSAVNSAVGSYPVGVGAGDFNGDGWLDAATVNNGADNVSVLLNDQSWPSPPPPSVSINDVTVTEGNTGTTSATFTVSLSFAYSQPITVHYETADGSATAGSDYTAASGDVIFGIGQITQTFTIAVLGDGLAERTETFVVNLSTTDAFIADGQAVGTISDDDYSYEAQLSAIEAIDLVAGAPGVFTILDDVDDSYAGVDLGGNTFTFYGVDYTSLFVSSNGLITFGVGVADYTNTDLSSSPAAPAIAPLWDDWVTNVDATDQVLGKFDDVDGNGTTDRLVIEWSVYHYPGSPSAVTFQAVLGLNAGGLADPIVFNYPDLDTGDENAEGSSATVGIKDIGAQGPNRLLVSADSASPVVGTGQALRVAVAPLGPSLSISNAGSVAEGNSGAIEAVFYVTLVNPPTDQTVTVNYATADGSATAPGDYISQSGALSFPPGTTSREVRVLVNGDLLNEDTESFTVYLSNPTNAFINVFQGTATIVDDDPLPSLAVNDVQVTEGNAGTTNAVFTVSLSAPSGRSVSVYYSTANGTAIAGSDYQAQSGWLTFAPGQLSQTVTILVNGDTLNEANETFSVNLSSPANAVITDGQGVATILDDDPVEVRINDVSVIEGNSGTRNATFTVTLSSASGQAVTVHYATANGTALAGSDYVAASGTLTIPAGQTSGTVNVLVIGDRLAESTEIFVVNLSAPTNATIVDGQGVGTITDDEPRISISDVTKREGNGNTTQFVFTVTLSAAYDQAVTVNYATADGTATTADHDYQAKSGTLTFAPGQTTMTISIVVYADKKGELDENFFVDLFGNSSNSLFTKNRGVGTILNDDRN